MLGPLEYLFKTAEEVFKRSSEEPQIFLHPPSGVSVHSLIKMETTIIRCLRNIHVTLFLSLYFISDFKSTYQLSDHRSQVSA